jgi:hypothetical protein
VFRIVSEFTNEAYDPDDIPNDKELSNGEPKTGR